MIQFETAQGKYLAASVPEGSHTFEVHGSGLYYMTPKTMKKQAFSEKITIVGIAGKLGEGECKSIIQDDYGAFPDFVHEGFIYTTAKDSFASLRRANNIPSSALIIKIEG